MPISYRYPNLININGTNLTDEGRQPLEEDLDPRVVTVQLASGKNVKFIKSIRKKWTITWQNVPMDYTATVDGWGGRNEIRAYAQSQVPLTFTIHDGKNPEENYTVWVSSYQETVAMRRSDTFRYNITLGIEEVG